MQKTVAIFTLAFAAALLVWTSGNVDTPHRGACSLLMAALVLMARDSIYSLQLGAGANNLRRLVLVWTYAAFFFAAASILQWQGPTPDLAVYRSNAIGAVVFGVAMVFIPFLANATLFLSPPYQQIRPIDGSLAGRLVFFGWPLLATIIIFGAAISPPKGGMQGVYPLFQMCFLPFLAQYYPIRAGFRENWPHYLPRLIGLVLLITALIAA